VKAKNITKNDNNYHIFRSKTVYRVHGMSRQYSHVSRLIRDRLHSLPVSQRIRFKLCLMMYKATHGSAPVYLSELCEQSCVEGPTRSSARGDLVVQRTRTKFGERAFVVAGPAAWNQLPCSIRNSSSVNSFKSALKTFLFVSDCTLNFHCCMHCIFSIGLRFVRRT